MITENKKSRKLSFDAAPGRGAVKN